MWKSPYAKYLLNVEKPGRYVGGEFGCVVPSDPEVCVALAFPDVYEIGMSHIGLSILYEIVNNTEKMAAERVFMPWPDMVAVLKENNLPLSTLETGKVLNEFDVVGFSLQYELTFTNMVHMLDLGCIPRRAENRTASDTLVIVGGPVAVEAEPIAPFVDVVVLGDGEEALPTLLAQVAACKRENCSRTETLQRLDALPFAYAPNLHKRSMDSASGRMVLDGGMTPVRPAAVTDLEAFPSGNGPVSTVQAVFDRYSVEIARGCTAGCRFCQAGYLYRPVRERSEESVVKILEKATCALGFDEVSLSALSSADHSEIEKIITGPGNDYLRKRVSFSVPSLRAYGLSNDVIEVLSKLRASGVTLAPEAGSQRLRDLINKNVTEADVMGAAGRFFTRGFSRIKLYFMLGLPTETDEDLAEIIGLASRIRKLGRQKAGKRAEVVVSVSTFVPKPLTPFECEKMLAPSEISRRQLLLRELARNERIKLKTHHVGMSVLEGVFARGDISLASLIEQAVDKGAMFCGWDEMYAAQIWDALLEQIEVNDQLKRIPDSSRVPWGHIDTGVTVEFRRAERDRAYLAENTPPCGVFETPEGTAFVCHQCGIKCKRSALRVRPQMRLDDVDSNDIMQRSKGNPRPAPVVQAGENAVRFRLETAFYGRQVYIGHLDRMRHLMRSLARAGLNLWYTQGFHPKPKIEAPPPLPLGTAALAEPFDVWLVNPPVIAEMQRRLNASLPQDLTVRKITRLAQDAPKLSASYSAVKYVVLAKMSETVARNVLKKLWAMDTLEVARLRKGITRTVEIRQYVVSAEVITEMGIELPVPEWTNRTAIEMTLELRGSGGTRPAEVLNALEPDLDDDLWVIRTEWIPRDETTGEP